MKSYTDFLKTINKLYEEEFTIDTIYEAQKIYFELQGLYLENINSDPDIRNGYLFLLNELNSVMFDCFKRVNSKLEDDVIKKMIDIIKQKKLILENIIVFDNHVFFVGQAYNDFSKKNYSLLADDNLQDISEMSKFGYQISNKYMYENMKELIKQLVLTINDGLQDLIIDDVEKPYLFVQDNKICYNSPFLHLYLGCNLLEIYHMLLCSKSGKVEVVLQYNNDTFYSYEIRINNGNIIMKKEENEVWKLFDREEKEYTYKKC